MTTLSVCLGIGILLIEEFSFLETFETAYTTVREDQAGWYNYNEYKPFMTTNMTSVMMLQSVAMLSTIVDDNKSKRWGSDMPKNLTGDWSQL